MNQPAAATSTPAAKRAASGATVALPYWLAEFRLIRTAVITALATLVIGISLVVITWNSQQQADDELARAQRLRDTAYARYTHVDNEKRDIRNFQQRYVELVQRGLIGEERRLDWVDAIRQAQEGQQLPPLTYEMDPQQPVRLEAALDLGAYQLRGSRMRVHMELLHEMQLFDFFADLHERGFFAVQDCTVKRLAAAHGAGAAMAAGSPAAIDAYSGGDSLPGLGGAGAAGAVSGARAALGADCTLNWFTMQTVGAAPAASADAGNGAVAGAAPARGQP